MGPGARVLEVGTGSGYQAAVLSRLVGEVYTVERIRELYLRARDLIARLGYRNVHCRHADGNQGWADRGPFDAIMVTAALDAVPEEILLQLADGGRLVAPLGQQHQVQELKLVQRRGDQFHATVMEQVSFVPFLSGLQ